MNYQLKIFGVKIYWNQGQIQVNLEWPSNDRDFCQMSSQKLDSHPWSNNLGTILVRMVMKPTLSSESNYYSDYNIVFEITVPWKNLGIVYIRLFVNENFF